MRFRVWVKAESPLVITANRATGNEMETLRWIPGTTWRGALAGSLVARLPTGVRAHESGTFRTLFLEDRVRFGALTADGERMFPLSARVCADFESHKILDLLLLRTLGRDLARECQQDLGLGRRCTGRLVPHSGLVQLKEGRAVRRDPKVRVTAHTAIANATLRVREEQFYSSTAVERGAQFIGELWAKDDEAAGLVKEACTLSPWLALGRARTRGQGHVSLALGEAPGAVISQGDVESCNRPLVGSGKLAFTVTLRSPCVLYDEWGMARPYMKACDVAEAAGLDPKELADYELADWFQPDDDDQRLECASEAAEVGRAGDRGRIGVCLLPND